MILERETYEVLVIRAKSTKPFSGVYLRILPPETPVQKPFPVESKAKDSGPDLFPGTGSFWKDASSEKTAEERDRRRREITKTYDVIAYSQLCLFINDLYIEPNVTTRIVYVCVFIDLNWKYESGDFLFSVLTNKMENIYCLKMEIYNPHNGVYHFWGFDISCRGEMENSCNPHEMLNIEVTNQTQIGK